VTAILLLAGPTQASMAAAAGAVHRGATHSQQTKPKPAPSSSTAPASTVPASTVQAPAVIIPLPGGDTLRNGSFYDANGNALPAPAGFTMQNGQLTGPTNVVIYSTANPADIEMVPTETVCVATIAPSVDWHTASLLTNVLLGGNYAADVLYAIDKIALAGANPPAASC
jgi:hypothetical protein